MSRITRWNIEKTKIKVVFRLQFHATHIPQSGWDKLYISFIPADSGKATAKTTKANVRNGACKWADPIYETTRLLQDIKTKQFDEKLYKLVVAMGSSRSSLLGEATINLADYADASKPSVVSLPLHGCESGAILHVTVQLLTSKTGFREFELQRELRERGLQAGPYQNDPDQSSSGKASVSEEIINSHMEKVSTRVRFNEKSKEHPLLEEDAGLNEEYGDSAAGFEGSSNTSESLYTEKHDTSSTQEVDSVKSTVSGDLAGLSQSLQQEKGDPSDHGFFTQGTRDWVCRWSSDHSVDNDLAIAHEENSRLRGCLEVAESSMQELKVEVSLLQNHSSQLGAETEKVAEQLLAEISSGERLVKEVSALKLESLMLKDDFERITNDKLCLPLRSKDAFKKVQDHLFENLEVIWSKGILIMEDKIREIQNMACLNFHERDLRFLHADLEALFGILQELKQGTQKEISNLRSVTSERSYMNGSRAMGLSNGEQFIPESGFDAVSYQPELGTVPCISVAGIMPHESDSVGATNALKGKIFELLRELDESKAERESLAKKMDQMECYYEALVQELEETQREMLGELQSLRTEHSTCLYRMQSTKAEVENMRQDMNEQILRFAEDKHELESLSKELERRAIIAEAALKRARLNYSIAVGQLQKDLDLLSSQVMSVFETNENLIRQAFVDSSQPASQENSEKVQNQALDSKELQYPKLSHCQNQYAGVKQQQLGGDILLEDLKISLHLQESLYQKVEEEVFEVHYQNVYLDVFTKILQETLLEASAHVKFMKERADELTLLLELSDESKELLMQRLQTAMHDVHFLNEYKATWTAEHNGMALLNKTMEANLENVTHENHLLSDKIAELDHCLVECKSYKSRYDACELEKMELVNLLEEKTLENGNLRNNNSSLQEELKMTRTDFDELVTAKNNLQNTVEFLQKSLLNLFSFYSKNFDGFSIPSDLADQDFESKDFKSVIMQLEEVQNNAYEKFCNLLKEKRDLVDERDKAQASLSMAESDMVLMKQKFEDDTRAMTDKIDFSNVAVQKLQLEIEAVAEKLKVSTEVEENYAQQQRNLLCDLEHFEAELQRLTFKNREIAEELLLLESVNEELDSSTLTVAELVKENEALTQCLKDKSEESNKLALELNGLKESFHTVHDVLEAERRSKLKLESLVTDLTSQMNEKHNQLLHFDQQKYEMAHLREKLSDLESEKSRVCILLQQSEECVKNAHKESYYFTFLEPYLSEMLEFSIAADVSLIFLKTQYETWTPDLVCRFSLSEKRLMELQKKYLDLDSTLSCCLAHEAHCVEENARLSASLNSLKSELNASMVENSVLNNKNSSIEAEFQEYKSMVEKNEFGNCEEKNQHALEVERLKHLLVSSQEEIDNLMMLKEELEVNAIVLKAKLDEQSAQMTLLEGHNDKVQLLQSQYNELSQKLSEQILKTEEFKNLSIHLKELKDKADVDGIQAWEKGESEAPTTAMQESLRIVFIKEQYETRLQELKHQLAVSKKHSEEMLWKLQDAIDDIENRKKSEASLLKRNEELGVKILEMEAELQSLISDRREKLRTFDLMKAELDCSMISLECCKEEKQKLEASLQESIEEKSRISVELSMVKELLETTSSTMTGKKESKGKLKDVDINLLEQDMSTNSEEVGHVSLVPVDGGDCKTANRNLQPEQDLVSSDVNGVQSLALVNKKNLLTKQLALINDRFKGQILRSSMDHLNSELERMKNENLSEEDSHHSHPKFPNLQQELIQLEKVNEELGSIYPLFNTYSDSGNALERVLALELELAEALQMKKKASILFQSSFLKQHNDEAAVFKSFRDINELIRDMLEIKGRYGTVESELKEMHDRYSQLSLQFAEVEGERQKLMMTLKTFRASRKAQNLNLSTAASLGDNS